MSARSTDCRKFQAALDVLGRPWTGLILNTLGSGPMRYSDLAARVDGLGDKTLSARLKELEAKGIVARARTAGPPACIQYALTSKGHAFDNVAKAIAKWGELLVGDGDPPKRGEVVSLARPRRRAG
jgi:DNA-binding HxlR family transcriptional regulator